MQWMYWILAVLISLLAGLWVYRADKKRNITMPWLTALLRSILICCTLLLILAPVISVTRNIVQKPLVLLLQDDSRSIANALGKDSVGYRKNVEQLIHSLSAKYRVVQWGFGNNFRSDSIFYYNQPATDIASALSRAQDFFGNQNLGAVIVATDGRYNQGEDPLYEQLSLHSALYTVCIGDTSTLKDVRISRTYSNKTVALNSRFEIRADILASLCNGYSNNISLQEAGNTISSIPVNVNTDRYDRSVSFTVKAEKAGLHHYILSIPAADGEKNIANNRHDVFVEVTDKKKNILIVCAAPHPDVNAISEALAGLETYKVTITTADKIPASLNDYQIIILHQVPSIHTVIKQIQTEKKPVWYIFGSQSNISAFNDQQNMLVAAPSMPHDVFASYNSTFNTFLLPKNIQAVMDKMPPLSLPVNTIQAGPAANVLFTQKNIPNEAPLWLLIHNATPMAVLAGEGIWRWRLYEYKNFNSHDVIDECIRQTISFLSANSNETPFKVEIPKYVWSDAEAITLNAQLLNANNEQVNTPDVQLAVTDSMGNEQSFSFERSGNVYRINLGIRAGGNYIYRAKTVYNNNTYTASGSFVVEAVPLELMEAGADYPLLYALSKKYHGTVFSANNIMGISDSIEHNDTVRPVIQSTTESVPLIDKKWIFFLILTLATAEWLLRKYWLAQ